MGSLVFEKCYPTVDAAADAYFSAKEPSYTAGATSYQSWYEKVGTVWTIKRQSIASGGAITNLASSTATIPAFPTCDETAMFNDGLAVGWLIAGVLVITWAAQFLRRVIR